jgi:Kef-type K+ transport system membrane component KefB
MAWCILAAIIAIIKAGSVWSALVTISLSALFVAVMLLLVKPWLRKLSDKLLAKTHNHKGLVGLSFFLMLASAYFTEIIGIHALFGAFLAGVIMPSNIAFREALTEKVSDISLIVLLPIFFAFTGLRTNITSLNGLEAWGVCALIIIVAIVGKMGGTGLAARLMGRSWKEAMSMGALMNARGLMELIVLNIGYDLGILSQEMFAMLVIMALVTTFATSPLLDLAERIWPSKPAEEPCTPSISKPATI